MRPFILLLLLLSFMACSKGDRQATDEITTCFAQDTWLAERVKELEPCFCETAIWTGTYQGGVVYEIRLIAPLCNGVNTVHRPDGTQLFRAEDRAAYDAYRANATGLHEIWRCSKGDNK